MSPSEGLKIGLLASAALLASTGCGRIADFDDFEVLTEQEYFLEQASEALGLRVLRCEPKYGLVTGPVFELLLHPAIGADVRAAYLGIVLGEGFDRAAADACLAQLRDPSCSVRAGFNEGDCASLFAPTVPEGGACVADANCIGGRCADVSDACGGVCVALAGEGEACLLDMDCAGDLWCDGLTCAPQGGQGADCGLDSHCQALYWCDPAGSSCQPLPDVNDACQRDPLGDDPCRQNLVCTGAMSPTCQVGKDEGEACVFGQVPCRPGLRCVSVMASDVCVPVVAPGEACDSTDNCPYGFACVSGVCQPFPSLGDSCDPTRECIVGACRDGTCQMLPAGASCNGFNLRLDSFGDQCEGYCDTTGPTDVCADAIADGTSCAQDYQCAIGSECVDGGSGAVCTPCGG